MIEDKPSENSDVTKTDILEANRYWLALVNAQSESHRKSRDPRLYRQASQRKLITPPNTQ